MTRFITINCLICGELEDVIFNIEHIVLMKRLAKQEYRIFLSTGGSFIIKEDEYLRVKQLLQGRSNYAN